MDEKRLPRPLRLGVNWFLIAGVFVLAVAFLGWGNTAGRAVGGVLLILVFWMARGLKKPIARQTTER